VPELAAISGMVGLWELTRGDPGIRVAIVDGPVDLAHPALDGAAIEVVDTGWLPDGDEDVRGDHGTWVAGLLVGQHHSHTPGVAPHCTALVVPSLRRHMAELDPMNTARSIEAAIAAGAHIVVLEQCLGSRSGDVDGLLKNVVRGAEHAGVLLVMPAGNDDADCLCFPQALPEVLIVGAYDDDGTMYKFSGWSPRYASHGIVAPGGDWRGVHPGDGTKKGTSCSAPVVAGVAALLLSLQLRDGLAPDPLAIRSLLLETAHPCTLQEARGEPLRCLGGKLHIPAATRRASRPVGRDAPPDDAHGVRRANGPAVATAGVVPAGEAVEPATIDLAGPVVYALGTLGYDFGTQARRDSFARLMAADATNGEAPPNPQDARRMLEHLARHPADAEGVIWTLSIELTPIYAIGPTGANAPPVFDLLTRLLADELVPADDARRVGRVAIPGRLSGRTVRLLSRQVIPVIEVDQVRAIHGWRVAVLAPASLESADARDEAPPRALRELLTRIHFELRNLGLTARDRALNFAVTNAFTVTDTLRTAVSAGLALDRIDVAHSASCRPDSDCWDVTLHFFDPENLRRARRVARFAVDVGDLVPVSLAPVRSWSQSPAEPRTRRTVNDP
jgi:hypothetical protein